MQEITELRRRGIAVIPCSARRPRGTNRDENWKPWEVETVYIEPLRVRLLIRAVLLCIRKSKTISEIIRSALFHDREPLSKRGKTVIHTLLGAYFAVLLDRTNTDHIHVHHGYFSCWIAMVAARLRGITYSVTLHGSDLLLHHVHLDTKLSHCQFCVTISEFNRRYILDHYRGIPPEKIFVRRIGVEPGVLWSPRIPRKPLMMLAVGRLHAVKNHAFLIRACAQLRIRDIPFLCLIAGEGKERKALYWLVQNLGLQREVVLLGHLLPPQLDVFYAICNLLVLTSRSEGLPVALMEAMARGTIVLAPGITGIPELVIDGKTGFLFREGSSEDFIEKIETISNSSPELLDRVQSSARQLIAKEYDRKTNLAAFSDLILRQLSTLETINPHENPVLQQI